MPRTQKTQAGARGASKAAAKKPAAAAPKKGRPAPEPEEDEQPKKGRAAKAPAKPAARRGKPAPEPEPEEDDEEIDDLDYDEDAEDVEEDDDAEDAEEIDEDEDEEEEDDEDEDDEEEEPEPAPKRGRGKAASEPESKKSTAMVRRSKAELAKVDPLDRLAALAGVGLENVRAEHLSTPLLYILQSGSPQTKKKNEAYIKGAEPGHFLFTRDSVVLESILCLPVYFKETYAEWWPRDASGGTGLVGIHDTLDEAHDKKKYADTEIVKTYNFYLLINIGEDEDEWVPCLFPCTKTKLKPAQKWLTAATTFKLPNGKSGPLFSQFWELTSVYVQKDQYDWYTFEATPGEVLSDAELIEMCAQAAESFNRGSGQVRVDNSDEDDDNDGPF